MIKSEPKKTQMKKKKWGRSSKLIKKYDTVAR